MTDLRQHPRRRSRARLITALALGAAGAALAPWALAQAPRPALTPDSPPTSASIGAPGEVDEYSLTIATAGVHTIAARGDARLELTLLGPDGLTVVETDPDAGPGASPVISRNLDAGAYVVRVSSADPAATGAYTLSVVRDRPPAPPLVIGGRPVAGNLETPFDVDEYSLRVTRRGTYTVLTTGETDVTLSLSRPNAREPIAVSDDDGPDLNALASAPLTPGTYVVRVRHALLGGTGRYRVQARPTPRTVTVPLRLGRSVVGRLAFHEEEDRYRLTLPRADRYQIRTRGRVDVVATLLDSRGREIAADDDSGGGVNPLIDQRLPAGRYTVVISLFDGRLGRYTISARAVPRPPAVPLALGAPPRDARFSRPREEDYYRIVVPSTGVYEIGSTGDTDVLLTLLRANGRTEIVTDDDSGPELNALIRRRLAPGTYLVRASNVDRLDTGSYGIFFRRA